MSTSVDNRVVQMEFDNDAFEKGVTQSIRSLGMLQDSIHGLENSSGFANVLDKLGFSEGAISRLGQVQSAASEVFSVIGNGMKSIAKIGAGVSAALGGGIIGMAVAGGKRRALNIEQAKFQLEGLKIKWEQVSDSINAAVDGTRYGLDSAAKAASQLAASNVELGDDMTHALRAISGVASMTNSEYDDIANIFTRVAGQGKVMANDLNSIAARGLNAAAELAKAMGTTEADVREMVSKGKIGFKEFAEAMNDAFGEQATKANDTFTGAMANARAALSRIGAEFFVTSEMMIDGEERTVGGLESMRKVFVALIPLLNGIKMAMAPIVDAWRLMTYRASEAAVEMLTVLRKVFYKFEKDKTTKTVGSAFETLIKIFQNFGKTAMSIARPFMQAMSAIGMAAPGFNKIQKTITPALERIELFTRRMRLTYSQTKLLTRVLTPLALLFKSVATVVGGVVVGAFDAVISVFLTLRSIVAVLSRVVWRVINGVMKTIGTAVRQIVALIDKIRARFTDNALVKYLQAASKAVATLASSLTRFGMKKGFEELNTTVVKAYKRMSKFFRQLDDAGQATFRPFMTAFRAVVHLFQSFYNIWQGYRDAKASPINAFFKELRTNIANFGRSVRSEALAKLKAIGDFVEDVGKRVSKFKADIFKPFTDGLGLAGSAISGFLDPFKALGGALSDARVVKLTSSLGKQFDWFGRKLTKGIKDGGITFEQWERHLGKIGKAFDTFFKSIDPVEDLRGVLQGLSKTFGELSTSVTGPIQSVIEAIGHRFFRLGNFVQGVKNLFAGLAEETGFLGFLDNAKRKISGLLDSLTRPLADLNAKIFEVLSKIPEHLHNLFLKAKAYLEPVTELFGKVRDSVVDLGSSFVGGFLDGFKTVGDFFSGFDIFRGFTAGGADEAIDGISDSIDGLASEMKKSSIAKLVDGIGSSFDRFSKILDDRAPVFAEWKDLFHGVGSAFSEFFDEVKPLESVGEMFRNFVDSMKGFGTDSFKGLGSIAGDGSGVAKLLDGISRGASGMFSAFRSNLPTVEQFKQSMDRVAGKLGELAEKLSPVAEAIGKILGQAIQNGIEFIDSFIGKIGELNISFEPLFDLLESLGDAILDFLSGFDEGLPTFEGFKKFFSDIVDSVGQFVSQISPKIADVGGSITGLLESFGGLDAIAGFVKGLKDVLDKLNPTLETTSSSIQKMSDSVEKPMKIFSKSMGGLSDSISQTGDAILSVEEVFDTADEGIGSRLQGMADNIKGGVENILPLAVTAAFSWRLFSFSKVMQDFFENTGKLAKKGGKFLDSITGVFDKIGNAMMDKSSKLDLIRSIVLSLVALIGALWLLTTVPTEKLMPAVGAVALLAVIMTGLVAVISLMASKFTVLSGLNMQGLGLGLLAIAGGIFLLAAAIKILSGLEIGQIGSSLLGIVGVAAILVGVAVAMTKWAPEMVKASGGLLIMAFAMAALTGAIMILNGVPWGELIPGIVAVLAFLAVFTIVSKFAGSGGEHMLALALGLLVLAGAMIALYHVIVFFNGVDWSGLTNGFYAFVQILGAIVVFAVILSFARKGMLMGAIGVMAMAAAAVVLTGAVIFLAKAMEAMPGMDKAIEQLESLIIVFGLTTAILMAFSAAEGAKAVLAIGAILAMSVAIAVLTVSLTLLSTIDPERLKSAAMAIGALVVVLGLFGVVISFLPGAAAGIIVLAGSILAISLATVVGAVGLGLFVAALTILGAMAPGIANGIAEAITTLGNAISQNVVGFAGIVIAAIAMTLAFGFALNLAGSGALKAAIGIGLLVAIIALVVAAIAYFADGFDASNFEAMGAKIPAGILNGAKAALSGVGGFFKGIGSSIFGWITGGMEEGSEEMGAATEAAVEKTGQQLEKLPEKAEESASETNDIFGDYLGPDGKLGKVMSNGWGDMTEKGAAAMEQMKEMAAESGYAIPENFLSGYGEMPEMSADVSADSLSNYQQYMEQFPSVTSESAQGSAEAMGEGLSGMPETVSSRMEEVATTISSFDLKGPAKKKGQEIKSGMESGSSGTREAGVKAANNLKSGVGSVDVRSSGYSTGKSLVEGIVSGIDSMASQAEAAAARVAAAAAAAAKSKKGADVNSPSKKTIPVGMAIAEGLTVGMERMQAQVVKTGEALGNNAALAVQYAGSVMDGIDWDSEPVIRPVLDLSNVVSGASQISGILDRTGINAAGFAGARYAMAEGPSTSTSSPTFNIALNYDAGADANQMVRDLTMAIKQSTLMGA